MSVEDVIAHIRKSRAIIKGCGKDCGCDWSGSECRRSWKRAAKMEER